MALLGDLYRNSSSLAARPFFDASNLFKAFLFFDENIYFDMQLYSLWCKPVDFPSIIGFLVAKPIVQSVFSTLPEFKFTGF